MNRDTIGSLDMKDLTVTISRKEYKYLADRSDILDKLIEDGVYVPLLDEKK